MNSNDFKQGADNIIERYNRRREKDRSSLYNMARASCSVSAHEKAIKLLNGITSVFGNAFIDKKYLEVGCGTGSNLLQLITWGCSPKNMQGCDIFAPSLEFAKTRLPEEVKLQEGNFLNCHYTGGSFDCIIFSTVFSSILDQSFRIACMELAYRLLRNGGIVLIYDFTFNNASNKDVRKVDFKALVSNLPWKNIFSERITLAPPLARKLERWPRLIWFLSKLKVFNTHKLVILQKGCVL